MGAYYSSGSRPNQTAESWGIARLASAITSGKSAVIDYHLLEEGCKKNSKALKLAKKAERPPCGGMVVESLVDSSTLLGVCDPAPRT